LKTTTKEISCDVLVAGGGMAGICAALSAARNGCRVVLVGNRAVLGGNASSEINMHIVGADCHGRRPGARESGIIEELRLEDAFTNPQRSPNVFDLLLYDKVRRERNIELLLETEVVSCETVKSKTGSRIVCVEAWRQSTEDIFWIRAPWYIDCTGDGRLGLEAGADFRVGRESKEMYGESLAQENEDKKTLGSSILITARKHESPQPFHAPPWARRFDKKTFDLRPLPGSDFEYGFWWLEWGGQLDTIKDNDLIRHELLSIVLGVWDYLKNSGEFPESTNWALDRVGAIPGKRESRRFYGDFVLTQQDVFDGKIPDDTVAYGGWWVDTHPPEGIDAPEEHPCVQHHIPHLYGIPLRSLYSRNVENLFFAGRNISATHIAFASTRVMATCAVMGQAIGAAAAVAVHDGEVFQASELLGQERLQSIQRTLANDDAFLPSFAFHHVDDLVRTARLRASEEEAGCGVENIRNGVDRRITSSLGGWAEDAQNAWSSKKLPASIVLEWPEEVSIREIRLVFDTGFERELTFSLSDTLSAKMVRGIGQPETVRSYEIEVGGRIEKVTDNVQRLRIHRFDKSVRTARLAVRITSTWGVPEARIFAIRVFSLPGMRPPLPK